MQRVGHQGCVHAWEGQRAGPPGGGGWGGRWCRRVGGVSFKLKLLEVKQLRIQSCSACRDAPRPSASPLAARSYLGFMFLLIQSCNSVFYCCFHKLQQQKLPHIKHRCLISNAGLYASVLVAWQYQSRYKYTKSSTCTFFHAATSHAIKHAAVYCCTPVSVKYGQTWSYKIPFWLAKWPHLSMS